MFSMKLSLDRKTFVGSQKFLERFGNFAIVPYTHYTEINTEHIINNFCIDSKIQAREDVNIIRYLTKEN